MKVTDLSIKILHYKVKYWTAGMAISSKVCKLCCHFWSDFSMLLPHPVTYQNLHNFDEITLLWRYPDKQGPYPLFNFSHTFHCFMEKSVTFILLGVFLTRLVLLLNFVWFSWNYTWCWTIDHSSRKHKYYFIHTSNNWFMAILSGGGL